jgi:hypothetical protein
MGAKTNSTTGVSYESGSQERSNKGDNHLDGGIVLLWFR